MENEEKILEAIQNLAASMEQGFSNMNGRFEAIEDRLSQQETKTKKTYRLQQAQAEDIESLKSIVRDMAKKAPLRVWEDGTAIERDDAYLRFEKIGIGRRKAMRALRNAGAIRLGTQGKNTVTIYFDGHCQRVIVVNNQFGEAIDIGSENTHEQGTCNSAG